MVTEKITPTYQLDNLVDSIKNEIKKEPWYWHVVNLAWTAGPVTFIAVYISYYIGYGQFTSLKTIVYFGLYTVLAGLFALAFQTVKNAAINPKLTRFKYEMHYIIDRYLCYISFCKEYLIISLPPEQRDIMSAWFVLSSSNSDIDMIQHAVYLSTRQKDLTEAIQRIEFYRKQGFTRQLEQEYLKIEPALDRVIKQMEPNFPSLAKTLRERFKGNVNNSKLGIERPQGFLSRLMAAANDDSNNENKYIRVEDVIALFNLVIELILDRRILVIHPEFRGDREFEKLYGEYEEKISDFKLIRRLRNNKIKELLHRVNSHSKGIEFSTLGINSQQLNTILKELRTAGKYRKIMRSEENKKLFDEINHKNKKLRVLLTRLKFIYARKLTDANISDKNLSIRESFIFLDHKQKIEAVELLSETISKNEPENLNMDSIYNICFDTINILDEKLNISESDVQIAVEESMAVDLNTVEPNFTTNYKIEMIANQINELQHSKTRVIHRFVRHLAHYYNFELSDSLKQRIVTDYQGEKECVDLISEPVEKVNHISLEELEKEIFTL